MAREVLTLRQAAEHVHIDANELRHIAQRGEIEATERGGEWYFEHRALDEWAQRMLLAAKPKVLKKQYDAMMDLNRREHRNEKPLADLLNAEAIHLAITAKAKAGLLRDMTDLADKSGLVYDVNGLFKELQAREETSSTAIGEGVAMLHPRFHDPFMFQETFIAYGRSERPVFFGAPDGQATRHFFLVCSADHELHLHILARLAMLAHGSDLMERLEGAETTDDVLAAVRECEAQYKD